MCGRYELHTHPAAIALLFGLAHPPAVAPRYNIAPMQDVPVVRRGHHGERELAQVRWGLVPRWAKDASIGARLVNVRAESLADKPMFRTALRRHRCLLPADGFFEWRPIPGGGKQPYRIGMKDGQPFGLGGITERWLSPEGEVLDTCAIVTTASNELLAPLHGRMPLILAPEHFERWLDVSVDEDVTSLLMPYDAQAMSYHAVSARVNAVRNDDAAIIEPVADPLEHAAADAEEAPHPPEQARLF